MRSKGFRSERENTAKLDKLKTETVTLQAELVMLKTPVIEPSLLPGFLDVMWESVPTMMKQLLSLFAFIFHWTHVHAEQALVKQTSVTVLVQFCSKILNNSFCNSFSAKVLHDPLIYKYTCCQQFFLPRFN